MSKNESRNIFDWLVFAIIHIALIGGITYAGFAVYGARLGAWVGVSALVAGVTSMYLFAGEVPGETLMKVWLGLAVALNAGYIVHNGARAIGVEAFNSAQIRKYEIGIEKASKAQSRRIAQSLGLSARKAGEIEKVFDDGVSTIAALLAFLELASAIVIFSIASRRVGADGSGSRKAGYMAGATAPAAASGKTERDPK